MSVFCPRNRTIDIAKGIGMLCVVYGHSGMQFGHYIIYMFHMPLFFFISGSLHKERSLIEGVKKKIRNLFVPYIILFGICMLIDIGCYGPKEVLKEYSLLSPNHSAGVLWFIISLFEIYVLASVIFRYARRWMLLLCCLFSVIGFLLSVYDVSLPLFIDSSLSMFIFYIGGYEFKNYILRGMSLSKSVLLGGGR